MSAEPADRIAGALKPYLSGTTGGLLLAVSGGPDSTALLHAVATARGGTPAAVATVDHGLRPGSAAEAGAVAALAHALGLPHRTLRWEAPRAGSGVQAAAREARYRLLADHAAAIDARLVLTGHTADDQAETVLMRLLAGSGLAGLAGMRRERALAEGVNLARPFLGLSKAELVAYCAAHGLPVVSDPSNADARYARARLRALLPALAAEGMSADRLCRLAERAARDEAALAEAAAALLDTARRPAAPGSAILDGAALCAAPEAVSLRAVDACLDGLAPADEAPRRLERLERLVLDALLPALAAGRPLRRTLRGLLIEATRAGLVRVSAAPPRRGAAADPLAAGRPDLLGKGEGGAYIADERVE